MIGRGILIFLGVLVFFTALSFAFGWVDVAYIKTIGKAKQNAKTEVFYETQAFVDGKNQEASKLYRQYMKGDEDDKEIIMNQAAHTFASIDVDKVIRDNDLKVFISNCVKGKPTSSNSGF
jgi:hypothetical protein